MKKNLTLIILLAISSLVSANETPRPDIEEDIPLEEAIRRVNDKFPSVPPLTEDEVVAAVQAIKLKHSDIDEETYEIYMRVVNERVLPKDMYFSRTRGWKTEYGEFEVDWKDLNLRGKIASAEEKKKTIQLLRSRGHDIEDDVEGLRIGGFTYRIRARFISVKESHLEKDSGKTELPLKE